MEYYLIKREILCLTTVFVYNSESTVFYVLCVGDWKVGAFIPFSCFMLFFFSRYCFVSIDICFPQYLTYNIKNTLLRINKDTARNVVAWNVQSNIKGVFFMIYQWKNFDWQYRAICIEQWEIRMFVGGGFSLDQYFCTVAKIENVVCNGLHRIEWHKARTNRIRNKRWNCVIQRGSKTSGKRGPVTFFGSKGDQCIQYFDSDIVY